VEKDKIKEKGVLKILKNGFAKNIRKILPDIEKTGTGIDLQKGKKIN